VSTRVNRLTPTPKTSFLGRRVNGSTFLVIEDDDYGEQPYIYVKIYPNHILITDTGCNTPRQRDHSITSLRDYLENFPLSINDGQPLNPNNDKKYIIICSHCHYDHILGLPTFSSVDPLIVASSFDRTFLLKDLSQHSLCKFLNVPTPNYNIGHWASHLSYFSEDNVPLRIQFLHIPGHTPDSLAWYDLDEHHLYIGDTFYERQRKMPIPELPGEAGETPDPPNSQGAIIFPNEGGNWIQYMSSLDLLLEFVLFRNQELKRQHETMKNAPPRVKVGCGHLTHSADAETMILEVRSLFQRIISGQLPVSSSTESRGVTYDFWLESEDARYSVKAPRRLVDEARKNLHSDSSA
jgi:glyoxylase-like metal-dependent hydrolase (beta-lactamase superfamily II)